MTNKEPVYITGHIHPDTDSIASAIAYAFFKRAMGVRAIPCRLGPVNAESAYLLKRFGFEEPMLLTDARVKLSDITLDPVSCIREDATIFECLKLMEKEKRTYQGVVDESMHLVGLITKSDIAAVGLGDTAYNIDLIKKIELDNICQTLDGTIVYREDRMHLNGKVSMLAMADRTRIEQYELSDRIVIVGDDSEAQKTAIKKGAGLLILVWAENVSEDVLSAAKENHCPIIISGHGAMNTSRYIYFATSVREIMKRDIVTFNIFELAADVGNKMLRSRYHIYPIVDSEKKLCGYAARYHIMTSKNKQIIMVDHNEFAQSVRAIEEARVLEVIDHHRISDFSSTQPVSFRNEIVGSTATIVATIFRENQIPVPQNLAGLLLGALLSDTMNFHSPTTTDKDRQTANILAAMADLDIEEFAKEMFAVTADTTGKTYTEMLNQDMKIYDIHECKLAISQVIVQTTEQVRNDGVEIQAAVESFCRKKRLDLAILVFSSIIDNGSVVFYGGNRSAWAEEAFPNKEGEEHSFQVGLLSRKQQILPRITDVINIYS
ncbi:MAG: putative manganese-dependent inorganic diphosphatase [Lachnospiraceae bacterium]|nr:putative manganese-dependent inorganic diphosphatase [Lachnospiraceae bacterium]